MGALTMLSAEISVTPRRYPIPGHGDLELAVPLSWLDQIDQPPERLPPTITFRPKSGNEFKVLITALWSASSEVGFNTAERIKPVVERAGNGLLSRSVETKLKIRALKGESATGYYYSLTDKAPKPGEFENLSQGAIGVGDLLLHFTILTHSKDSVPEQEALAMLQKAVQR